MPEEQEDQKIIIEGDPSTVLGNRATNNNIYSEDDRSVTINRDANKSIIIPGDRNTATITITNYYYHESKTVIPIESTDTTDENLPCPYRGLFHFGPNDAEFFFGREVFIQELFTTTQTRNFIPVLGASGSGKSSLVMAGLVPKLQKEGYWKFTHFRPSSDPFHALAESLVPLYEPDKNATEQMRQARQLAEYFVEGSVLLQDVLSQIERNYPNHRILLIADQFEELYTLCAEQKTRHRFLDILLTSFQLSSSQSQSSHVLVATMRADFLGNALSYRRFADVLQNADIKLGPMNREELSQVIVKPAEKLGVTFEAGLRERILDDVEDEPGNLPLLEFALTELWKRRKGKQLTHAAYEEIGQVQGALARHADENYSKLSTAQKEQVRRIFIQLVRPGEGTEDTRRLATKVELTGASWSLVKQLADARLVVTSRNAAYQETVEVVHEALIRNWSELRQWMDTDRSFRTWQERLRAAMYQWEQTQRDEGGLLRGAALAEAEENLKQRREDISSEEQEFIEVSLALRDRLLKKEEKRRKRQFLIASITSVVFVSLSIVAAYQWRQAEITIIDAVMNSSQGSFNVNRNSLDALINALKAGKRLQRLPWGSKEQKLQASVLSTLAQSVSWVREQNRLEGHKNWIQSVSFSQDGQMLATGSYDNTVKLWRRDGSLFNKTLEGHTKPVTSVRFSPDDKIIASGSWDGTVRLWDSNGNLKRMIQAHDDQGVISVSFSPDGEIIASASSDKTVKLWRMDGQLLHTLTGHQDRVRQVSFSPKGDGIVTVSDDQTVKLWSQDGKLLQTIDKQLGNVMSVDFSGDGQMFATASRDGTVKLWSREGELIKTLEHPKAWSVSVSRDGQTIASGNEDGTIKLWVRNGKDVRLLDTWTGHQGAIPSVTFSPDGQILATASNDSITKLWQVNRSGLTVLSGHQDKVLDAAFSPDDKRIASASADGTVRIWNREGKQLLTLKEHQSEVNTVSFNPNGNIIASGGNDKTIKLWDVDGQLQKTLQGHEYKIFSVSFSNDGQTIASASADATVKLWSLDGKELITLKGHSRRILSVAFASDGQIATGAGDDNAKLWSSEGKELQTLKGHTSTVRSVGFSPDGTRIVTASDDETINLWRRDGTLIKTLRGHTAAVLDATFSPDGKIIASASSDKTIKLWQSDGTLITTLAGHEAIVNSVRFSSDSKWLVSTGADQLALLWDVSDISLQGLQEKGCTHIRDYLQTPLKSSKKLCN
ncbi:WD40 repeat domain-containing protein [Limnoraphis robusta Tam1]|uniref:WD40 repeat domain-containing protein n=1 Tax=Limnoraphis robusta TaxID=1118279 RepID=UPI002B1F13C5|nr:WD40 repeat domain-containing protein [Limnoraphis robusta]MEA5541488.1 WD40 repeat domain-containing protein [Limnoraphis robusta Tam1]